MEYFLIFSTHKGKPNSIFFYYFILYIFYCYIFHCKTPKNDIEPGTKGDQFYYPPPPPSSVVVKNSADSLECKPVGSFYTRLLYLFAGMMSWMMD